MSMRKSCCLYGEGAEGPVLWNVAMDSIDLTNADATRLFFIHWKRVPFSRFQ